MGGNTWRDTDYQSHVSATAAAGRSTFQHTVDIQSGTAAKAAHELLDPLTKAGPTSAFAGQVMREVVISDEHPLPTPIVVGLDVTGSNIEAAHAVHAKLPLLFGVLQMKGYVPDPQILIAAIGDAYSDYVPLQVGQFESDIRIAEMVEAMYLEGNGGGQDHETYELLAYYLAYHTYLETVEKQGRKGYCILIGDEMPYPVLARRFDNPRYYRSGHGAPHELVNFTGDNLEEDLDIKQIFDKLKEQYEVYFLFQQKGDHYADDILPAWRELLGERALVLDDPNAVCEFIAGLLALDNGYELDEIEADLKAIGADSSAIHAAGKALATVGGSGGAVATTDGSLPNDDAASGTSRI